MATGAMECLRPLERCDPTEPGAPLEGKTDASFGAPRPGLDSGSRDAEFRRFSDRG